MVRRLDIRLPNNVLAARQALALEFMLLALSIPGLDYLGSLFFSFLGVYVFAPFVVTALALTFTFLWTAIYGIRELRTRSRRRAFRLFAAGAVSFFVDVTWIRWTAGLVLSEPRFITHGEFYRSLILVFWAVLIALFVILMVVVPLWAIVLSVKHSFLRDWKGALWHALIPLSGVACFQLGSTATDLLTVWRTAEPMQSAIRDLKHGNSIPRISQAYPVAVIKTDPPVAIYSLNGPLFLAEYISYDEADSSSENVAIRIGKYLEGGTCSVAARRVEGAYYWVTEAC